MSEIKLLEKIIETAPNLIAVVNFPENHIPSRGYIIDKKMDGGVLNSYDNLIKNAENHFKERVFKIPKQKKKGYLIGFISGNKNGDKDLFLYPYEQSKNSNIKFWTEPYITKNGTMQSWRMRQGGDHHIILGIEEIHRRKNTFKDFIEIIPNLSLIGLKYKK